MLELLRYDSAWTARQKGIERTKILIHTVFIPTFGESETQFFPFPSCLAVIWPCTKHYHTSKKIRTASSFTFSKGFMIGPAQGVTATILPVLNESMAIFRRTIYNVCLSGGGVLRRTAVTMVAQWETRNLIGC